MLYRLLPLFLKAIAKQSVNVVFSKYILNGCDEITDQPNTVVAKRREKPVSEYKHLHFVSK